MQLARLRAIPGSEGWLCVSVQALHRFYRGRTERVVASWMTRQDRDLAILDNLSYVESCIDDAAKEWSVVGGRRRIVFAGFSQGVGMAYRSAAYLRAGTAGVIAVGGDIPPELGNADLRHIPAVLIARGANDEWYPKEKLMADRRRLEESSVPVSPVEFSGGHDWPEEFAAAASAFLRERFS